MFNIDLEKKLNDLKEGIYYKTLNGKTYKIEVKIEYDYKMINVFFNKNLIFESLYYKNGKIMKEGIEFMKDNNKICTLNDIINKMVNLSEGYAEYDNMSICVKESKKINENSSTSFKVEIEDENCFYEYNIPFTNEYYINIKSKNNDFNIYTKKDKTTTEKDNRSMRFSYNDKEYALTNKKITDLIENKEYIIHNNNLIYKIDDKTYIGYSFENNKVYIYNKKQDSINNDIDNDYIKSIYVKNLAKTGNICIDFLDTVKNKIKEKIDDKELNNLIDDIKMPKFNTNLDTYYDDIISMANLYINKIEYLNMLDNEDLLNKTYNIVNNANITIVDKKINNFKDCINNNNLKDLNTLYCLKKQLKEIIKLKKKQAKSKKKILKNTDIEN